MVERIIVLNLPDRQDRQWFARGHLAAIGVPPWSIEVYPARKGSDYRDMEHIQSAAAEDGFPFIKDNWYVRHDERGQASVIWNWCSMLRRIVERDEITLIILDDRALTITYAELCGLVWWLSTHKNQPFHALQLQAQLFDFGSPDAPISYMPKHGSDCQLIKQGFDGNGDYATVFSPAGAKRFLGIIAERPFCGPERLFYEQSVPGDTSGFYCHSQGVVRDCGYILKSDLKSQLS